MKVHGKIVFFLILVQITCGFSLIDFIECGGGPVDSVFVDGCDRGPCIMQMGKSYIVSVYPEYINPRVDNTKVQTGIIQYGAYFEQASTCHNPCIYSCPITTKLIEPKYDVHFNVSAKMVPMVSILRIQTSYYQGNVPTVGFCVQLDIVVTN